MRSFDRLLLVLGFGVALTISWHHGWAQKLLGIDGGYLAEDVAISVPIVPLHPVQHTYNSAEREVFAWGEWEMETLADYEVSGIVMSRRRNMDVLYEVSEFDIAMVWGDISVPAIARQIRTTHGRRYARFIVSEDLGFTIDEFVRQSANVHTIPATDEIKAQIRSLRKGDVATFKGRLVEVRGDKLSRPWRSSLIRTDHEFKGCEIMLVEEVVIDRGP